MRPVQVLISSALEPCRASEHENCPTLHAGAFAVHVCSCRCHWRLADDRLEERRKQERRRDDGAWTWNGSAD